MENIQTNRLILKEIKIEDAEQIYKLFSDKELLKYTDNDIHKTIKDTKELIGIYQKEQKTGKSFRWAIWLKKTNNIIGILSIYHINRKHKFATIGSFLDRNYQKNGFMPEARLATINYAFNKLKLNRLEAQVFVKNMYSIKMLEKLGFKKEGRLRQNFMINNKLEDSFMYSILIVPNK